MDASRSLELFSWHAFKHSSPTKKLLKLSRKAVSYCGGIPLALEVLGSLLLDRASEWENMMKLLENNQSSNAVQNVLFRLTRAAAKTPVRNILKMSYDFLDNNEKKIFLEIACFYIEKDRHNITQLLSGYKLDAETGITKLIERRLLKVDKNNKLEMHDLLREMGR
ncbi:Winged helix DNA-binding domain superfamily [Sesbania bispinosa]|nr:Winged helix DNA-binding domain superfamily [Sesbania bispinosa]